MDDTNKKFKVLIVDDVAENIKVLSNILYEKGLSISMARNGLQAIKSVAIKTPDLILLDVSMPVMDGYEVCKHLKADPKTKEIPIIFITARTQIDDIVKGLQLGAVDYITKPFNTNELLSRVFTQLELKHSRDTMAQYIEIINKQNNELNQANQQLTETNKLLDKQNEELKNLNATKDKFFSIIAHDLKNPFNALIGFSEFLLMYHHKMSKEKIELYHTNIHQSALQGYDLLQNLLKWSRTQTNRIPWQPQNLNLQAIVLDNFDLLTSNAERKKLNLISNIDPEITIFADENMLNTIFRNLLSNAIKFSNHEGEITVGAQHDQNTCTISVKDNGIGISKEDIKKLFKIEVHHTTKGTSNETGTGLGLLLCSEFVEKNNGTIWINSELGYGSTFSFTVPISKIK